jgi:hypothetical protein
MDEDDVVDIVDPSTDEVISHCFGPSADGSCPMAGPDGAVLCNGYRIAAPNAGPELWNLFVPAASRHCPRAWNLESVGY